MPLQTAEAPTVTADLGPGDLQSLPVFNPTDSTRTQVVQTFSTLDIAQKAKKAGGELCHEHRQLISGLNGEHLLKHAISMKRDLTELAGNVRQVYPIYRTVSIHLFFSSQSHFSLLSSKSTLFEFHSMHARKTSLDFPIALPVPYSIFAPSAALSLTS